MNKKTKMNLTNSLQTWNELLDAAPQGAVLMGGAIRDWACNHEAKDYDIFYNYRPGVHEAPNWEYIPRNYDPGLFDQRAHDADYNDRAIGSVYDYDVRVSNGQSVRVQLIGVHFNDPREHFRSFDHTLTLGRYGAKGLYIDKRMSDALVTRTVTWLHGDKDKALERAQRAVSRVDPGEEAEWNYQGF
jgi:hypothetical protein